MSDYVARDPIRILIVNPFGIGDVLFTTPLIRALRKAFPNGVLGYLCNRRTSTILEHNPHLDELFIYEKDEVDRLWRMSKRRCLAHLWALLRRVRRSRFDCAIDLSLGERYGIVLGLLGVPRRIGFNYRGRGRVLTDALPIDGYHDEHVVAYHRRLLRFMGVAMREEALELKVSEADERWAQAWVAAHHDGRTEPLVGIIPAGGVSWGVDAPFRRWSAQGFATVGDALVERYRARLVLFGEASDRPACSEVARLMRHDVMELSGRTTLGQFVSLIGRLDLVICNDGGPLHLAVSQGVNTVSIFGPVDPDVYGAYPQTSKHRMVYRANLPCRPCYHRFKLPPCPYERACLTTIEPQEVVEACAVALEHRADEVEAGSRKLEAGN